MSKLKLVLGVCLFVMVGLAAYMSLVHLPNGPIDTLTRAGSRITSVYNPAVSSIEPSVVPPGEQPPQTPSTSQTPETPTIFHLHRDNLPAMGHPDTNKVDFSDNDALENTFSSHTKKQPIPEASGGGPSESERGNARGKERNKVLEWHKRVTGTFTPRAPHIPSTPYPEHYEGVLCKVPAMAPTTFFLNASEEIPSCYDENHFTFTEFDHESGTLRFTNCDGRAFYQTSQGLMTNREMRAYEPEVDVSEGEQVIAQCRLQDGFASFDFYTRVRQSTLVQQRTERLKKRRQEERSKRPSYKVSPGRSPSLPEAETRSTAPEPPSRHIGGGGDNGGSGGRKGAFSEPLEDPPLNVVMLVIDSLSRANFLRSLPETVDFLRNIHTHTGGDYTAYDFKLFNIVGSGTYRNLPPIVTGTSYNDAWSIEEQVLLHEPGQGQKVIRDTLNEFTTTLPSLWDLFMHEGYATSVVEEACIRNTGSIGRVWQKKVKKNLEDLREYTRFTLAQGHTADHTMFNVFCEVMDRMGINDFFSKSTRPKICFGGKYVHEHTFDYLSDFLDKYPNAGHFSLAMMAEAHEATARRIREVDQSLKKFLEYVTLEHPNTAVMILGDHGLGYGDFAKTDNGKLEYKLPALMWAMPSYVLSSRPNLAAALDLNQERLVTGFDLYHTIAHLADIDDPKHRARYLESLKPLPERHSLIGETSKYGASLLFPVSGNRTCKEVDIPMEYCSCTNYHTVENPDADEYRLLADYALLEVGRRANVTKTTCEQPVLDRVEKVQIATAKGSTTKQFVLTIRTMSVPHKHITAETFEAVLVQRNDTSKFMKLEDQRIKTMDVGTGFSTDKKVFDGPMNIFPSDVGTVWCVNRWFVAKKEEWTKFDVQWVKPKQHESEPDEVFKVTDVVIDKSWIMAWQPLTHRDNLDPGRWTIKVVNAALNIDIAVAHFYILRDEYPGMPIERVGDFWKVSRLTRTSAYEPHRICADPSVSLEMCVCNTAVPFSPPSSDSDSNSDSDSDSDSLPL